MKKKEIKYYGIHACLSIWERRPKDIIRVYIDPSNIKIFKQLLKWCADQKKAYHIVPTEELNKVSDSIHHEGICILAQETPFITPDQFLAAISQKEKSCILYLDGVQNPHNLGSIIRSCAHFGVTYILGEKGKLPALSPSACRIAKGGAERIQLVPLENPLQILQKLKQKKYTFIGTSSHAKASLYEFQFPAKTILAIGSESHGVSKTFQSLALSTLQIPGTGHVESLNVAIATSLCLGEYCRQHQL